MKHCLSDQVVVFTVNERKNKGSFDKLVGKLLFVD